MSDYWYTDEYGRKRHVSDGISSNNSDNVKYHYDSIYNSFYKNGVISKDSYLSLTNCPECGDDVYFCNCSNGGRVFFDTLSPGWEKHPCTSATIDESKNINNRYSLIIPTHNYYQYHKDYEKRSTSFEVPNFLQSIKIDTTNEILYKNITQNTMILVRKSNDKFYLTIIVTSEKFKNYRLCNNEGFKKQYILQEYLVSILSKVDLSVSIDTSNEIVYTDDNKKIIKIDKFQSKQINQLRQSRKKPKKIKNKVSKEQKQVFKPVKQEEYVSKKTELKIKKKKNEQTAEEETENISIDILEGNGWKIIK